MGSRNRFRNLGKGSVYACAVCGRPTRYTGSGTECCGECYEIAGIDNMVNDNGYNVGSQEHTDALTECEALLAAAIKKGGNGARIKASNEYIWPEGAT